MTRHADNIGRNIIALQHPKESLADFIARCDNLRSVHGEAPPPPVQASEEPKYCEDCGNTRVVLSGAQKFVCQTCKEWDDVPLQ